MAKRSQIARPGNVATRRARGLRQRSSIPERVLWSLLRDRRLGGLKFRRQVPVGPYIADYYCLDAALVVELDGASHDGRSAVDAERQRFIESQGVRVLRITNGDLVRDRVAVAEYILRVARERLSHDA